MQDPGNPGAPAAGSGQQVVIEIEQIMQIANATRGAIADDAKSETRRFVNNQMPEGSLGELPPSVSFMAQATAAHTVFDETIQGVLDDLQAFGDALYQSAQDHRTTDEAVQSALASVNTDYEGQTFNSQRNFDNASTNPALAVDPALLDGQGAGPADSGVTSPDAGASEPDSSGTPGSDPSGSPSESGGGDGPYA